MRVCVSAQDEADTVGCCSLRREHLRFPSDHEVEFDFLGKDSMRYHQVVDVSAAPPRLHRSHMQQRRCAACPPSRW
jgi:DNA topoisomerase IB